MLFIYAFGIQLFHSTNKKKKEEEAVPPHLSSPLLAAVFKWKGATGSK